MNQVVKHSLNWEVLFSLLVFFMIICKSSLAALLNLHTGSKMIYIVTNLDQSFYEIKASLTKNNHFFVKAKAAAKTSSIVSSNICSLGNASDSFQKKTLIGV